MRYQSTVNRCFAEIAAISLPTGAAKEESITYARVLIERGCSSNCCHFKYICNATSRQALSRKRRDSQEHIPECPIDGKKQSIDQYQSILMVSINWWSINNHRKASNQEPTPFVRMERGKVRVWKKKKMAFNRTTLSTHDPKRIGSCLARARQQ